MNETVKVLRSELAGLVGAAGLVACDHEAGVITIVPTRIPSSPIVVHLFGDGWLAVMCGASFYQEISPDFGAPLAVGLVREIVEGRCTEYVLRDDLGEWQIRAGLSLADGSYSQEPPDGQRLVSWRHPALAGDATTVEITPL